MIRRSHVMVFGDVTGVGFRNFVKMNAIKYSLTGWVRNLDHGIVEVLMEGNKENLEKMINLLSKGPEVSFVKNISIKWYEAQNEFNGFEIRHQ